jgi:hypothetical protein
MVRRALALLLVAAPTLALLPLRAPAPRRVAALRAEDEPTSLGGVMAKQLFGGFKGVMDRLQDGDADGGAEGERKTDVAAGREAARAAGASITDIDSRAQAGDVTFEDFLKVGRTFRQMKGNMPGMPGQLTQKQIDDTLEKFDLHEKIVEAMSPDEKGDPQLVLDDLKNTENQLPRIQRIAKASGCAEKDVALFCAEFEAMRQSTQRIAAGEDPDEVNADIGSSNRAQRRAAKKAQKKRR